MARRAAFPLLVLLSVLLVGCDHATKALAVEHLSSARPLSLWPGVLELTVANNHDTAFSLLSRVGLLPSLGWLVVAMSAALVALLAMAWSRWREATTIERLGYAVALAGAAGNLLDRIARGHVVDFVHVRYWPVFNVADVLLSLGVGLILVASLRRKPGTVG